MIKIEKLKRSLKNLVWMIPALGAALAFFLHYAMGDFSLSRVPASDVQIVDSAQSSELNQ